MAEETETKKISEYERLEYGAVANQLAKSENFGAANIALKEELKPKLHRDAQVIFEDSKFTDNDEAIAVLSRIYNKEFQEYLGKEKVSNLVPYIQGGLEKYLSKEEQDKVKKFYEDNGKDGVTLGSIQDKYYDLSLEAQKKGISEEDRKKAIEGANKLSPFIQRHETFLSARMSSLTRKVMEESDKRAIKKTVENL